MKRSNQCPKCGSKEIIVDAKAVDHGQYNADLDLSVATYRNPSAILFKGKMASTLSAWVCCGCGFVELYADSPRNLKIEAAGR